MRGGSVSRCVADGFEADSRALSAFYSGRTMLFGRSDVLLSDAASGPVTMQHHRARGHPHLEIVYDGGGETRDRSTRELIHRT